MKFTKRSLGQNFLIDKNIIKKIVDLTNIKNRNIIEIGPGTGALTDEILDRNPKSLILIEKDFILAKKLKTKYSKIRNIKILNKDILNVKVEKLVAKDSAIFGNLPYNISSQILIQIIRFSMWPPKFKDLIFMFQKEMGEKITGKFLTSGYGRLSILANYRLSILKSFLISPNCFFPKPKIKSVVIHFQPKNMPNFKINKIQNLEKVTNILFSNKRKMINKNIKKLLNKEEISEIDELKLNSRPSEIKPEVYYKITELFQNKL